MKFSIRYCFIYDIAVSVSLVLYCVYSLFLGSIFIPSIRRRYAMLGDDPRNWYDFPGWSGVLPGLALLLCAAWFISGVLIWRYEITTIFSRDILSWRKCIVIGFVVCIFLTYIGIFNQSPVPRISDIADQETAIKILKDYTSKISETKAAFNRVKPFWEKLFTFFILSGLLRLYFIFRP